MSTPLPGNKPFVSIIITSYNYEKFLQDAIESALNQSYRNVEVIIVDDGSTDNSRKIIASYADRVIPILKENGGQGSAFNAGFRASRGDIVIFLDSDDTLFPDSAEMVVNAWRNDISKLHYSLQGLDARGHLYRRGGACRVAPAVRQVLAQVSLRPPLRVHPRTVCEAVQSGHDPGLRL